MSNKELAKAFKLTAQLMELHDENPFKIRSIQNAAFKLERHPVPIETLDPNEIGSIEGVGKSIQTKITDLLTKNSFPEMDEMLKLTPKGVIDMLSIKGIGPKKVRTLWKELGIESTGELLYACNENRLVELKGFGSKTQLQIKQAIEYMEANQGKYLFAVIEPIAQQILQDIRNSGIAEECSYTGEFRRKLEIQEKIELVLVPKEISAVLDFISSHPLIDKDSIRSNEIEIAAVIAGKLPLIIFISDHDHYASLLFRTTANPEHLELLLEKYKLTIPEISESENDIYALANLPYFEPELREGRSEFSLIENGKLPTLIEEKDLKGILHNHTTYSDGAHTLEEMAVYCKGLGYQYLGICDHSKSAFYANGLQPERILKQQEEIDVLNSKLGPFKIFKGIESDILNDGSLDYPDEILNSFDFIVASIHSGLRMDKEKATQRLLKAIENPYTTILGHPTGRLLLAREGYPIDHQKIIDACAANGVIIELNANPYRLDLDWRYIPYALDKNVMISINPDAHRTEGYHDMHYGVCVARKGGLTKSSTFNAFSLEEIEKRFLAKKGSR
ncbi:MAG: DNA polymerase/3'-5' exonuclease PolX [Bacteroidetes bacterium]|nr:DNA polymerase/3'-5' exonuclease PolX [Bacteroidota bacterium]